MSEEPKFQWWPLPTALVVTFFATLVPTLIVDVDMIKEDPNEALKLIKGLTFSTAILATLAASMRLLAHDSSKNIDLFGKVLTFSAALLALITTSCWVFLGIG